MNLSPPPPAVGDTRAARDFFAGQYAKVVSETFDVVSGDGTRIRAWRSNTPGIPLVIANGLGTIPEAWPALVAEGRSNGAIARELVVSEAAIGKHIGNILAKLDLPPADETHRRVLAVLAYLRS